MGYQFSLGYFDRFWMVIMDNINRIVTAKDYGDGSARGYIRRMQVDMRRHGKTVNIVGLENQPTGTPVKARIWQSQWIADCECKGASFVDPDEPIFFCFNCGNRLNGGMPRPVEFPPEEERMEIERLILERPVNDLAGLTDLERIGMAQPMLKILGRPLSRSWIPGESVETLREQQDEVIQLWKDGKLGADHVVR
jgi:hypothetical protein